jgi:hypothetical protein
MAERSWANRFGDLPASLKMAEVAVRAAFMASESEFFSAPSKADLAAEALSHLGNARRINSDLPGAEQAFAEAEAYLQRGSGDRAIQARLTSMRAFLCQAQGRAEQAAVLLDREIPLRRLLGEGEKLGDALVNRGWMEAAMGNLEGACWYLAQGVERAGSPSTMLIALHVLAEELAREGRGRLALRVVEAGDAIVPWADAPKVELSQRWLRGLAHSALGEAETAERELRAVRDELLEESVTLRAGGGGLRGVRRRAARAARAIGSRAPAPGRRGGRGEPDPGVRRRQLSGPPASQPQPALRAALTVPLYSCRLARSGVKAGKQRA